MPMPPYRVTVCGLAELGEYGTAGVSHVLSLLDPDWPEPEDFADYAAHQRLVLRFHDTIRTTIGLKPATPAHVAAILAFGAAAVGATHFLVHCHMGISRSTAAAAMLLAQGAGGREDEVFAALRRVRPKSWPNSRMIGFADTALGCRGALVEALHRHFQVVATTHPDFARELKAGERAAEVP